MTMDAAWTDDRPNATSHQQSGLHDDDSFGEPDSHLTRRRQRLAVQFYGALSAYNRLALGPEVDPSLATCEQLPDPDAVRDSPRGDLSAPGDSDLLDLAFRVGVDDPDRASRLALRAKRSTAARAALSAMLSIEDTDRRQKVLGLLERDRPNEAKNLALCGQQSVRLECPDEFGAAGCGWSENYVPIHCDHRLCEDCMNRQIGKKVERYGKVVRTWSDPTFYTLTIRNVSDPETGTDALVGAFGRFRRRHISPSGDGWTWHCPGDDETPASGWKAKLLRNGKDDLVRRLQRRYINQGKQIPVKDVLKGGIYALDVKQKGPDDWNLHLHVLADAHWIPQAAISDVWDDLTGSPVVDVRRIYGRGDGSVEDALMETVAYSAKPPEFEELDDAVEYITSMKGRRFIQTFGSTHGNVPDLGGHLLCERCESTPAWWNYEGLVHEHIDNMGSTHGPDSDDPPPS